MLCRKMYINVNVVLNTLYDLYKAFDTKQCSVNVKENISVVGVITSRFHYKTLILYHTCFNTKKNNPSLTLFYKKSFYAFIYFGKFLIFLINSFINVLLLSDVFIE